MPKHLFGICWWVVKKQGVVKLLFPLIPKGDVPTGQSPGNDSHGNRTETWGNVRHGEFTYRHTADLTVVDFYSSYSRPRQGGSPRRMFALKGGSVPKSGKVEKNI